MTFNKKFTLLNIFCSVALLQADEAAHVYHQIIPLITKKINIAQPTEEQKDLLNGAEVFLEHGTSHQAINPEIVQAIASVDFFTDILPQYFRPHTVSGTIQTALLTAQMTNNFDTLAYRQSIIKYFNEHPEVLEKLDSAFEQSKLGEKELLSSLVAKDTLVEDIAGNKQTIKEKLYFTSDNFKTFNNKYILGACKRIKASDLLMIPTMVVLMLEIKYFFHIPLETFSIEKAKEVFNILKNNPKLAATCAASFGAVFGLNYILKKPDVKQDFDLIHTQQRQLIEIAKLINQMKTITQIISKNSDLQNLFSEEHTKLRELFDTSSKATSDNLKYVMSELQSSSFKGEPTYYFSKQGKILATHYYLNECKAEVIPYLEAFGKIDAYLSAAKLYQKYQTHPRVKFCLPEFVNSATPVLDISEYWHPLINPNTVVTNSLNMGNGAKNLMITGPNAGGKTTSLMSLMINIIFAQSFGIAPSAKLVMTPFAKIHSYLDITTNLQEGLSLFAAEVDRAKKLKNSIMSCTGSQKTFTIIDEIFSGTNPDVASDVGSKFATQLGDISHSMTIITTHFPALTKVGEDTGTFTNYKVADATIMADGKIVYPFKLVPGISSQNIAQHMLEQQNII
jgi:DNA mismatch repair protein MutS